MTLDTYKTIYTLLFALSGVFFVVAVFCFFNFHIVDVIRDLYDLDIKLFGSRKEIKKVAPEVEQKQRQSNLRIDAEPPTDDSGNEYPVTSRKRDGYPDRLSTFGDSSEDDDSSYTEQNRKERQVSASSEEDLSRFEGSANTGSSFTRENGHWTSQKFESEELTDFEDLSTDESADFSEYETEPNDDVELAKERIRFVSKRKTIICSTDERIDEIMI